MTAVKICGMMRKEDVLASGSADYQGFVVRSPSRRSLTVDKARGLMSASRCRTVLVSSCPDVGELVSLAEALRPDVVQAHSCLGPEQLVRLSASLDVQVWGLVPMGRGGEERRCRELGGCASAAVLDTGEAGGTGRTHDWALSAGLRERLDPFPLVLAGGLTPGNVAQAVRAVRPFAVDVSGGVERGGKKDHQLIARFIEEARGA